jgi:hypothetical protein
LRTKTRSIKPKCSAKDKYGFTPHTVSIAMFAQFQSFIVIGLIIALLALGGSFAFYRNSAKAEIAELTQQNVAVTIAVKEQARTIDQMIADAKRLATAGKLLDERMAAAETQFVTDWTAIEALDLSSDASETERRVNSEFERSIEALRAATAR